MLELSDSQLATLTAMLSYRRPYGSQTEDAYRRRFLSTLPGVYEDQWHNLHVSVGKGSRILWSAHTDTVHRMAGRQRVHVDKTAQTIRLSRADRRLKGTCLGADDGAGVFILREMILAGVAGHYIFHHAEEVGGIGSGNLATFCADWLSQNFDYAIALDRAGTSDIVTHQMGGTRTASDTFAHSIAGQLPGLWLPAHGSYTDTAEYDEHIPECSNLSVGYGHAHTADEFLHYGHVGRLLHCLTNLDERALVVGNKRAEEAEEARRERERLSRAGKPDSRWTCTTLHRRASQVDRVTSEEDIDAYEEATKGFLGEDDDYDDFVASVWCEQCDEPKAACQCEQMSEDDRAFLRYLRGLD